MLNIISVNRRIICLAATSLAALTIAQASVTAASAQESGGGTGPQTEGFGDIVVTARSREESLYETPLSITSLGAEEIESANLRDIADLSQVAPGFFYTPQVTFSSSRLTPAIRFRGMTIPRNDPLEQLGGIFIDGVYLFGGAQSLTFDDIQRVEVIKGPQSALFGRGTFSGAINFITREPAEDRLKGRLSAGIESRDSGQFTASIEGPLFDGLTFRISGSSIRRGGHYTMADGGKLGREQSDVVNAQLVWKPVDGLRFRVRHSEVWLDDSRNMTVNMNANRAVLSDAPNRCQTGTLAFWCGTLPSFDQLRPGAISVSTSLIPPAFARSTNPNIILDVLNNNRANPQIINGLPYIDQTPRLDHAGLAGRFYRTSAETDYTFANGMSAHLIGSLSKMKATTANNTTDDTGFSYVVSTNIMTDKSIDFRLNSGAKGPFTWLVGGNYFKQRSLGGLSGTGAIASVVTPANTVQYTEPAVYSGQGEVEYYSAFFGLGYAVTDWVSLDFEGRYQVDKATTSLGLPTATASTYKQFLPRAIVTFKPAEKLTIYGSWARGALRGTTNSNFTLLFPELQAQISAVPGYTFDVPVEKVDSYEVGVKQVLSSFRYAVTGYYMDWQNLKNTINTPCLNGRCGPTITGQFAPSVIPAQAEIYGVEMEADWKVTQQWDMSLSFDYVHARYKQLLVPLALTATGKTDASGKTPVGFPSIQASFNTTYRDDMKLLGEDWEWYVRGEVNYTGRIYIDEINQSWIRDKARVNLRLGFDEKPLRLEAYVENLFNDKTWMSAARGTGQNFVGTGSRSEPIAFAVLPRLRSFGLRASFDF